MAKAPTNSEQVKELKKFFDRSTACLTEADSGFAPKPEMMTIAQHVAHSAQAIDWFVAGAFSPDGMSMNFEEDAAIVAKVTSLKKAKAWLARAIGEAAKAFETHSAAEWRKPIKGTLMAGEPRSSILSAMTDHLAHHRGALTVYARMLGRVPKMPYM